MSAKQSRRNQARRSVTRKAWFYVGERQDEVHLSFALSSVAHGDIGSEHQRQ